MAVAEPGNFFKQKRQAAEIKTEILPQYFAYWAANQAADTFMYLDLPAGPGYDAEEQPAWPIRLLENISHSAGLEVDLNERVQTYFYDSSEAVGTKLRENLENLPFYQSLAHPPIVLQDREAQVSFLEQVKKGNPALISLDPFSSNFSGEILYTALQKSDTDLFMLFSYSKLRQAILATEPNPHLSTLFGERLNHIRQADQTEKSTKRREQLLVQEFEKVLQAHHFFSFKFKINLPGKDQTSHYLLLASPIKAGYLAIKEILHPYSEVQEDGVPLFISNQKEQPPLLPGFFRLISEYCQENLTADLAQKKSQFHYQTIRQIFQEHSPGTNYIKKNYFTALARLKEMGHIDLVDNNNKKVKEITDASVVFYKLHGGKRS